MASITIRDMSVSYNKKKTYVIKDLSLDIKDGEFCVFLGPSGCGKSTAMHCIAGLLHPASGEIRFDDEVMTSVGDKGKNKTFVPPQERNIAMVFQEYALYPNMSVRENMSFALKTKKIPKAEIDRRVDYMAEMLSIEPLLERRPAELSGGQRQRVALARALVGRPRVLVLDDATSAVDPVIEAEILDGLRGGDTTMVVVAHRLSTIRLADRVVHLSGGEVHGVGTHEELLADPEYAALVTAYEADEVAARAAEADLDDAIDRDLDGGDDRGHAGEVSR